MGALVTGVALFLVALAARALVLEGGDPWLEAATLGGALAALGLGLAILLPWNESPE